MDPMQCTHPTTAMKARGNKQGKWWTCANCQSRWKRISLDPNTMSHTPTASEIVTVGKHAGRTMEEVFQYTTYVQWVLMTAETGDEPSAGLMRMARYFVMREQEEAARQMEEQMEDAQSDSVVHVPSGSDI